MNFSDKIETLILRRRARPLLPLPRPVRPRAEPCPCAIARAAVLEVLG